MKISRCVGVDDAVAGWLGSYDGQDSMTSSAVSLPVK